MIVVIAGRIALVAGPMDSAMCATWARDAAQKNVELHRLAGVEPPTDTEYRCVPSDEQPKLGVLADSPA